MRSFFSARVLHLLIGEGVFDGVDHHSGHGVEQLAVLRIEGGEFAAGAELVVDAQGALELPFEGEGHGQAIVAPALGVHGLPFEMGRFSSPSGAGGHRGEGRTFRAESCRNGTRPAVRRWRRQ